MRELLYRRDMRISHPTLENAVLRRASSSLHLDSVMMMVKEVDRLVSRKYRNALDAPLSVAVRQPTGLQLTGGPFTDGGGALSHASKATVMAHGWNYPPGRDVFFTSQELHLRRHSKKRITEPMPIKIRLAVVAALMTAVSVNATAIAQSRAAEHQSRSKAKATALGLQYSDAGIPIYNESGHQTGTYRGPVFGFAGTRCDILTPGGFIHVCQYGYN